MFGDSLFLSISSRLVTVGRSRFDGMLQNRFTLLQVRLDVAHEFLGFRLEAARHIAHVTRRDVCGRFRASCYGRQEYVTFQIDDREAAHSLRESI